jgi:hypothetical protein
VDGLSGSVRRCSWLGCKSFRRVPGYYRGETDDGQSFWIALPVESWQEVDAQVVMALETHVLPRWAETLAAGQPLDLGYVKLHPDRVECWTARGFQRMPLERLKKVAATEDALYFVAAGDRKEFLATLLDGVRFPALAVRVLKEKLEALPQGVIVSYGPPF